MQLSLSVLFGRYKHRGSPLDGCNVIRDVRRIPKYGVWSPLASRVTIVNTICWSQVPSAMDYEKLDNEELLRLSLAAINGGRDAQAVVMLKTLLERDPRHAHAHHLLAAQHAQMGLHDRAEAGFRAVLEVAPDSAIVRFQLGQLLVMKGAADEARQVLTPVARQSDSLGAYARAMMAAASDDTAATIECLRAGFDLPQEFPALTADMRRLSEQLQQQDMADEVTVESSVSSATPRFLGSYGRGG